MVRDVRRSAGEMERQRTYAARVRALYQDRDAAPSAYVATFGCQQNVSDGERIRGMLAEMGFTFTDAPEGAALVVLNTCAVREHAEQRVFGALGALTHTKKADPSQIVAVCGCMAQEGRVRERIRASYRHVDLVFGPQALWKFPELLWEVCDQRRRVFDQEDPAGRIAEGVPVLREEGVRAWIPIMYGCDNFCAYCIVPYVRGRERSRDPDTVVEEAAGLVSAGRRDLTLLGQNVDSYGRGTGTGFPELLRRIDRIPGDYWIRFLSSHPKDAGPELFDAMASCSHVARQLHLPVQSGNDRILAAMGRRYTVDRYRELVACARSVMPGLVLTSDVIVGFPGETEAEAMDTVALVEEIGFDALFTFLYSPRPGTRAASMPDPVPREEKQRWFDELLKVQNARSAAIHAALVGETVRVLVDGEEDGGRVLTARTEGGRLVRCTGDRAMIGQFADARVTGSSTWSLTGEIVGTSDASR